MSLLEWIKWRIAWWRWFLVDRPYRPGDPLLGPEGPVRQKNRRLLMDRYNAREPRRPDHE